MGIFGSGQNKSRTKNAQNLELLGVYALSLGETNRHFTKATNATFFYTFEWVGIFTLYSWTKYRNINPKQDFNWNAFQVSQEKTMRWGNATNFSKRDNSWTWVPTELHIYHPSSTSLSIQSHTEQHSMLSGWKWSTDWRNLLCNLCYQKNRWKFCRLLQQINYECVSASLWLFHLIN